ncbi:MAG: hypothetical protein L6Q60_01235 [Rhodocyclaceae bacterium]|nr:hypothetical protein [Rhodocyclaceae bacterium]
MNSAVIINLDYERHSVQICRRVWDEIAQGMTEAGFSRHHRLFLAEMDRETACTRAKGVVNRVEELLAAEGIIVFDVIREFYWFEYEQINDLLAPANQMPEISYLDDTGAFSPFLKPNAS